MQQASQEEDRTVYILAVASPERLLFVLCLLQYLHWQDYLELA
jgi:hypothetical protein